MLRFRCIIVFTILLRIVSAVFDKGSSKDVAIYWQGTDNATGQNSKGNNNKDIAAQKSLIEYCKSPLFTVVILAFLVNLDLDNIATNLNLGPSTQNLENDIKTCQTAHQKTLILSFGGETFTQSFASSQDAIETAQKIWYTFGPPDPAHPVPRPFGNASLDGFDFDFEANGEAQQPMPFLVDFARELRSLMDSKKGKKFYLTAAPQCIFPDKLNQEMLDAITFDAVFVQFYNNPRCGQENFLDPATKEKFNIGVWDKWVIETSSNKDVKVFLGIPGGVSAVKTGGGYVEGNKLGPVIEYCKGFGSFGGVMIWDASQAFGNEGFLECVNGALGGGAGRGNSTTANSNVSLNLSLSSASGITSSTASLDEVTSLSTAKVIPLPGSSMGLSSSASGMTPLSSSLGSSSTVRDTSTNTNTRTINPPPGSPTGLNSLDISSSSSSSAASGGFPRAALVATSSSLDSSGEGSSSSSSMDSSSFSPSVLNKAAFTSLDDSPLTNTGSSNVAPSSASRSLTVTPFLLPTSGVSALDNTSPATGGTVGPETLSLSADEGSAGPTSTIFTTTTSTSSSTSKAKTPSSSADQGGLPDLSRSISSPPGEKTKTSFTQTTTATIFLSRQTVTVTITTPTSSLGIFVTSVRSSLSSLGSSRKSSMLSRSSSMASSLSPLPIPAPSEEEPSSQTPEPTKTPFSIPTPIPTPSESQDPELETEPSPTSPSTPSESQEPETSETPEESTCPLLEASTVTMSATLVIAQPTTFTEMRTVLKAVEKTVDRTETETETMTETVPATGLKWVQVPESTKGV